MNRWMVCGLAAALSLTGGCIREDLDPCPEGSATLEVRIAAERFQARPPYGPGDLEPCLSNRIRTLDYRLYRDDALVACGRLDNVADFCDSVYVLRREGMAMGRYRLTLVANAAAEDVVGDDADPAGIALVYTPDAADFFMTVLPLEVDCPCVNRYHAVLRRVHGVVRFRFGRLPEAVRRVEAEITGVGSYATFVGSTREPRSVRLQVDADRLNGATEGSMVLGAFSTVAGERSAWLLRLYADDAGTLLYERLVTDTLYVRSNRLLDLRTTFGEGGALDFDVRVDPAWDGSSDGGGGEIL